MLGSVSHTWTIEGSGQTADAPPLAFRKHPGLSSAARACQIMPGAMIQSAGLQRSVIELFSQGLAERRSSIQSGPWTLQTWLELAIQAQARNLWGAPCPCKC